MLDNSGSMDEYGAGSGQKRIALLKTAAKQLVDTLALQAAQIKQVDKAGAVLAGSLRRLGQCRP